MIEKFLIKRCSTEVQVMAKRMRERPEDFREGSTWKRLVDAAIEHRAPFTWSERMVIRKEWKKCHAEQNRKKLLDRIMAETINPTAKESLEDGMDSYKYAQMQRQYAQLRGGITNIGGPPTTGQLGQYGQNAAQGSIIHGLYP